MGHHELWLTKILNDVAAAPARAVLEATNSLHIPGVLFADLARPWDNWAAYQLLVLVLLILVGVLVRSQLSVDTPGKLQMGFESVYGFVKDQAGETISHHSYRYLPWFFTFFLFILACNLIGLIPGFESPTMVAYVPLGCAVCSFIYYNYQGFKNNGFSYLKHYTGPIWWLIPLMLPIEVLSNLARPLSLTVRLYANMFVGEMITETFLSVAPWGVPIIFMALHTFVALLQAFIFMLLSMVYVGMATEHDH